MMTGDKLASTNSRSALLHNVESLRISAFHELVNIYMFMAFTEQAIERYPPNVSNDKEREQFKLTLEDVNITIVGTTDEILARFNHYKQSYLYNLILRLIVSHFESIFFNLLSILLTHYPKHLISKTDRKQIDIKEVINSCDKNEIVKHIIEKQLDGLKYKRVREWFEYLYDIVNIKHLSDEDIGRFAEIKATRDLLVHNEGIVNKIYIDKAGKYHRAKEGEKIEVTHNYIVNSYKLINKTREHVFTETINKYLEAANYDPT